MRIEISKWPCNLRSVMSRNKRSNQLKTELFICRLEDRLTPSPIPAPPGLVSWWPGDGDAVDIVGSNNGSLENGAGHAVGYVGDAFNFDGADDLMQAGTSGLPTGSQDRTLALWVRI